MRIPAGRARCRSLSVVAALAVSAGCALDITRERIGAPIARDAYEELVPGEMDAGAAIERLGAPDRIERENDAREDHLWWFHRDGFTIDVRFQLPLALLGYRHNVFQYFESAEHFDRIHLVFDENAVLRQKDLHLAVEEPQATGWEPSRFHLAPRAEYAFLLLGDGDLRDYDDLFAPGFTAGVEAGYQLAAPVVLGVQAAYGEHDGRTVRASGARIEVDELELSTASLFLRLEAPVELFANLFDVEAVRRILFSEGRRSYLGWRVFIEGSAGGAYNEAVRARVDGRRTRLYDRGIGFTSAAQAGIQYAWEHVALRVAIGSRSTDRLDGGNSGLPDDGTSLETWSLSGAISVRF